MDKSLFIFILVGLGFLYLVTNFVGEVQNEDPAFQNSEYKTEHKYDKYYTTDSIGEEVLDLTSAKPDEQIDVWNHSTLKKEFLSLYPDFMGMKQFVKERTRGEPFQQKMLKHINTIQEQFMAGKINAEEAKRRLSTLH